jgi:hypothetical protein
VYVTVPASVPVAGETIESTDDFGGLFAAKYAALTRLIYRVTGDTGSAEELSTPVPDGRKDRIRAESVGWLERHTSDLLSVRGREADSARMTG